MNILYLIMSHFIPLNPNISLNCHNLKSMGLSQGKHQGLHRVAEIVGLFGQVAVWCGGQATLQLLKPQCEFRPQKNGPFHDMQQYKLRKIFKISPNKMCTFSIFFSMHSSESSESSQNNLLLLTLLFSELSCTFDHHRCIESIESPENLVNINVTTIQELPAKKRPRFCCRSHSSTMAS